MFSPGRRLSLAISSTMLPLIRVELLYSRGSFTVVETTYLGTLSVLGHAVYLAHHRRVARVVLVNRGKTPYDKAATLRVWTGIGPERPRLVHQRP
jgi:hypothetical protein